MPILLELADADAVAGAAESAFCFEDLSEQATKANEEMSRAKYFFILCSFNEIKVGFDGIRIYKNLIILTNANILAYLLQPTARLTAVMSGQ